MDYQPSLNDIPESQIDSSGYQPSIDDIPVSEKKPLTWKSLLPKPSLPLGLNVTSGLLSSVLPKGLREVGAQLPQAAFNQPYGTSQKIATGIGETIPSVISGGASLPMQAISGGLFGAANAPSGERLQSAAKNALSTIAIGKTLPLFNKLLQYAKPKEVGLNVQRAHDLLEKKATDAFQEVSSEVEKRGINQTTGPYKLSESNNLLPTVDKSIFTQIRKNNYFPKTSQFNKLVNDAKQGDYNALRKLQSNLWTRATKAAESDDIANVNKAEEMFDLRDRINQGITNHLMNTGNKDLAEKLNIARQDFHDVKNIFYNKDLPRAIPKLVGSAQKHPNNLMDILLEDSAPMKKLREYMHKESFVPTNIPLAKESQQIVETTKKWGKRAGLVGLGAAGVGLGNPFSKKSESSSSGE